MIMQNVQNNDKKQIGDNSKTPATLNQVERLITRLWALAYEDDGPNGICAQAGSVTTPWRKLFFFETYDKLCEFIEEIEKNRGRKNSRVVGVYRPEPYADGEINFIK